MPDSLVSYTERQHIYTFLGVNKKNRSEQFASSVMRRWGSCMADAELSHLARRKSRVSRTSTGFVKAQDGWLPRPTESLAPKYVNTTARVVGSLREPIFPLTERAAAFVNAWTYLGCCLPL